MQMEPGVLQRLGVCDSDSEGVDMVQRAMPAARINMLRMDCDDDMMY